MARRLFWIVVVCVFLAAAPRAQQGEERIRVNSLLINATTTASGAAFSPGTGRRTFHAYGITSAGSGAATIVIEVSNLATPAANADWITAGTITLTLGTTRTSDGFATSAGWKHVRARVSAFSGTGATVNVLIGTELSK